MDGFGDDFNQGDVDPAAEFLAREHDQLAGLEDELDPIPNPTPVIETDDSFFAPENENSSMVCEPNSSFEIVDNLSQNDFFVENDIEPVAEEEPQSEPTEERAKTPPASVPKVAREEPEKIRKWREEQKKRLEEKDAAEEVAKDELRISAKRELDDWYKHHAEQIAKTKSANRNAEKQFVAEVDEIEPGTEWERIAKLCDFNPKSSKGSKDISRMRSIILQLKQSPLPVAKA